ncbi:MAG: hypothetical protein NVV74_11510 [Magnetospirillum sp.]|nr:hypothetical protein [Magnetospirillum sp.]
MLSAVLAIDTSAPDCLRSRMVQAGNLVANGSWASCHAILSGLRSCGERGGCPVSRFCTAAAERMLSDVRGLVCEQSGAVTTKS